MSQTTAKLEHHLEHIPDAFMFPIERVIPMQNQPRTEFEEAKIAGIEESIKEKQGKRVGGSGLIHPLLVRWAPGAFVNDQIKPDAKVVIIAGQTRFESAKRAGLTKIPVIVTDMNSEEAFEDAVTENVLRGDLPTTDEGRAFQYLMNKWGVSALGLAKRLYKDASREGYIQNRLDMLRLNAIVRPLIDQRPDSLTAARRIQTIKEEWKQKELVELALSGATFAEINEEVRRYKGLLTPEHKEILHLDRQNRNARDAAFPPKKEDGNESKTSAGSTEKEEGEKSDIEESTGGASTSTTFGSAPAPGVQLAPRVHVGDALDSILSQLNSLADAIAPPVNLPPATRRDYRVKVENLRSAFQKIEERLKTT